MSTATELAKLSREDLTGTATKLGVKSPSKDEAVLIKQIEKQAIRNTLKMENEARAEVKKDQEKELGSTMTKSRRPTPQDICIKLGQRVIAEFKNNEHPSDEDGDGADVEFICGSYFFHLYDSHRFVLPRCMVSDNPLAEKPLLDKLTKFWITTGMSQERARKQAISDLQTISMPRRCVTPVFKHIEDPRTGDVKQVLDRNQARFMFIIHGDAPKDAELGELMDPEDVSEADEIAEAMVME